MSVQSCPCMHVELSFATCRFRSVSSSAWTMCTFFARVPSARLNLFEIPGLNEEPSGASEDPLAASSPRSLAAPTCHHPFLRAGGWDSQAERVGSGRAGRRVRWIVRVRRAPRVGGKLYQTGVNSDSFALDICPWSVRGQREREREINIRE